MANASMETVPKSLRDLRACLLCSLIKTTDQFTYDGCDNCDEFLRMRGNRDMVYDCTSSSFDGIISMMSPDDGWVAKWQRTSNLLPVSNTGRNLEILLYLENFKPGCYAISVTGRLPASIIRDLKASGVVYRSRDTSQKSSS